MKKLYQVRTRLWVLIILPFCMVSIATWFATSEINRVSANTLSIAEERLAAIHQLTHIASLYTEGVVSVAHKARAQMLFWGEAKKTLSKALSEIQHGWSSYRATTLSPEEQKLLSESKEIFSNADAAIKKLQAHIDNQSSYSMGSYVDLELYPGIDPLLHLINQLIVIQEKQAEKSAKESELMASKANKIQWGALILQAILLLSIGFHIIHNIQVRLVALLSAITHIEKNRDFTKRVNLPARDEFGDMGRRFDRMINSIAEMLSHLQKVTDELDSASCSLVSANSQTRNQAKEQQQEISNMTNAMRSVSDAAETVINNAGEMNIAILQADQLAEGGRSTVIQTQSSIENLSAQTQVAADGITALKTDSEAIGNVISVIQSIAEQTNLLALNAAIEAARAGEQGRGFAVVADEVRSLAQRTAESTLEIQAIVEKLQQRTQQVVDETLKGQESAATTVSLSQQSGQALEEITEVFGGLEDRSSQINTAAKEQISVAQTLANHTQRVDELSEQTFNLSHSASETGSHVASLAEKLRSELAKFKV